MVSAPAQLKQLAKSADNAFTKIGAPFERDVFAPLVLLSKVGSKRVKQFNRMYRTCLKRKMTPGLYDTFVLEMDALAKLAKMLDPAAKERVLVEMYERYQAVAYRMDAIDSFLADTLRVTANNLSKGAVNAAEALLKRKIAALKAQTADEISKLVKKAKVTKLTKQELALLKDLRQFTRLIKTDDKSAWRPIFEYLEHNNDAIRKLRNLPRTEAAKKLQGYRSKVKGLLGEAYSLKSPAWVARRKIHMQEARVAARKLGYKVMPIAGTIKMNNKETWDEAILLVSKGSPPQAILHTAAQTKVEKQISAVDQIRRDKLRESGAKTYQPSILKIEGKPSLAYVLRPHPDGVQAYRYLLHAKEGKLSEKAIQKLIRKGTSLDTLKLDMTIEQFNRIADHLINASVKVDIAKII